jgi:hypothetical protein
MKERVSFALDNDVFLNWIADRGGIAQFFLIPAYLLYAIYLIKKVCNNHSWSFREFRTAGLKGREEMLKND